MDNYNGGWGWDTLKDKGKKDDNRCGKCYYTIDNSDKRYVYGWRMYDTSIEMIDNYNVIIIERRWSIRKQWTMGIHFTEIT